MSASIILKTQLDKAGKLITQIPYKKGFGKAYNGAKWLVTNTYAQGVTATGAGGLTAYRIYNDGLDRGREGAREDMAETYEDLFSKQMTASTECNALERAKRFVRDIRFDNGVYPTYTKIKNGIGGILMETLNNSLNIAAVGGVAYGLISKTGGKIKKVYIPAISAGYLLLNAAKTVIVDIFGFRKKPL